MVTCIIVYCLYFLYYCDWSKKVVYCIVQRMSDMSSTRKKRQVEESGFIPSLGLFFKREYHELWLSKPYLKTHLINLTQGTALSYSKHYEAQGTELLDSSHNIIWLKEQHYLTQVPA